MVMQWRVVSPGGLQRYPFTTETDAYRYACQFADSIDAPVTVERSDTGEWGNSGDWRTVYTVHPRLVTFEEV